MFFKDITGQDKLKQRLTATARSGNVAHAMLFSGQAGYGTLPLALAMAQYMNCTDRSDTDSCGHCPSCLKYNELVHPDLHFVFPIVKHKDEKDATLFSDTRLELWRPFLLEHTYFTLNDWIENIAVDNKQAWIYAPEGDSIRKKVGLRIYEADYRILFVWKPELMYRDVCANKLLKLIEEPPDKTLIFMISDEPDTIIDTIRSRAQLINVPPIDEAMLAEAAVRDFGLDNDKAKEMAHLAEGNYIKLTELIEGSDDEKLFFELFTTIMRNSYQRKVREMKEWAEQIAKDFNRDKQKRFLAYCQRMIRENFARRFKAPAINYMNSEEEQFSTRFAEYISERNVEEFIDELTEAEQHISLNTNSKMVFFDLAIHFIQLIRREAKR